MAVIHSGEAFAFVGGVTLCYETFGDPGDPPLLMIMGLASQMILWEDELCEALAETGRWVIRFDNRDVGRSTIMRDSPVPTLPQLATRRGNAYTLEQMADDSAGLLDVLGIETAEIVGASMGGMIAQLVAIRHPRRARSLVSIMSTTGARRVGQPDPRLIPHLLRPRPRGREAYVTEFIKGWERIGSRVYPPSPVRSRGLGELCFERGVHPAGSARQMGAIRAAADRTAALGRLTLPTTVIHGDEDRLVRPSGGAATAAAIPGARLQMIPGMAHHLPVALWPQIIDGIISTT